MLIGIQYSRCFQQIDWKVITVIIEKFLNRTKLHEHDFKLIRS